MIIRMNKVKTIIFFNIKGGVGKTTLTVNTASKLARTYPGKIKILIIDLDAQAGATNYIFGPDKQENFEKTKNTTYNLLKEYIKGKINDLSQFLIQAPRIWGNRLYVVPGSYEILEIEREAIASSGMWLTKLKTLINMLANQEGFTHVFIDPPATFGVLSQMALAASDYFVIPVIPDELGKGSFKLFRSMEFNHVVFELRSAGIPLENLPVCGGVIFNRVKTKTHEKISKIIREEIKKLRLYSHYQIPVYETLLGDYIIYTKCLGEHKPIFEKCSNETSNDKQAKKQFDEYYREFFEYVIQDKAKEYAIKHKTMLH